MQLYLINILFFLIANFLISITIKKYTYEKFFIYVVIYFVIVNFVNLAYLQNIDLFTFQILFSVISSDIRSQFCRQKPSHSPSGQRPNHFPKTSSKSYVSFPLHLKNLFNHCPFFFHWIGGIVGAMHSQVLIQIMPLSYLQ